jgi:hypothetical protein
MLYDEDKKKGSEQNQRNCSKCKYGGKTATAPERQKSRHLKYTLWGAVETEERQTLISGEL